MLTLRCVVHGGRADGTQHAEILPVQPLAELVTRFLGCSFSFLPCSDPTSSKGGERFGVNRWRKVFWRWRACENGAWTRATVFRCVCRCVSCCEYARVTRSTLCLNPTSTYSALTATAGGPARAQPARGPQRVVLVQNRTARVADSFANSRANKITIGGVLSHNARHSRASDEIGRRSARRRP
eukprot:6179877-Pleurochrysis_carterae.AAC.2